MRALKKELIKAMVKVQAMLVTKIMTTILVEQKVEKTRMQGEKIRSKIQLKTPIFNSCKTLVARSTTTFLKACFHPVC